MVWPFRADLVISTVILRTGIVRAAYFVVILAKARIRLTLQKYLYSPKKAQINIYIQMKDQF